jgi:hypothetical protein
LGPPEVETESELGPPGVETELELGPPGVENESELGPPGVETESELGPPGGCPVVWLFKFKQHFDTIVSPLKVCGIFYYKNIATSSLFLTLCC